MEGYRSRVAAVGVGGGECGCLWHACTHTPNDTLTRTHIYVHVQALPCLCASQAMTLRL